MKKIIFVLLFCLTSCSKLTQKDVGQFVYVDCFNTIHVDRTCASKLAPNPKTKEERMANMQGVVFIDTANLNRNNWDRIGIMRYAPYQFCPKCVNDEAYRHIDAIMDRNTVKPPAY